MSEGGRERGREGGREGRRGREGERKREVGRSEGGNVYSMALLNWLCLRTSSAGDGFEMEASLVLSLLYLMAQGPSGVSTNSKGLLQDIN